MKNAIKLFLLSALCAFWVVSAHAITLNIFASANLGGERTYGSSGAFSTITNTGYTPVGVNNSGGQKERRVATEFDLSAIPAAATITSAELWNHNVSFGGTSGLEIDIFVASYAGDGVITAADMLQDSNTIDGPYRFQNQNSPSTFTNPIVTDALSSINSIFGTSTYAGFLLYGEVYNLWHSSHSYSVSFYSILNENEDKHPVLKIEYELGSEVPEPASIIFFLASIFGIAGIRKKKLFI